MAFMSETKPADPTEDKPSKKQATSERGATRGPDPGTRPRIGPESEVMKRDEIERERK